MLWLIYNFLAWGTLEHSILRAWRSLSPGARALLSCERCGGSADDPEYDVYDPYRGSMPGPCAACHGYGFDRHNYDLRRMRLLELA